jgi:hypothetical protein
MTSVTTTSSTQDPSADLGKTIQDFNALVKTPESPAEENLWYSWRFLQIYSFSGLRLPNTEASLKLRLGMSDPGKFSFFVGMKEAYNEIHEACNEFVSKIFPQVIEVGTSLLDFASDASLKGGDVFSVLIEMLDAKDEKGNPKPDTAGALELIGDLQKTTKTNQEKAGQVKELLGSYKAKLVSAQAKVETVQTAVQADEMTSQATIDKLSGEEGVAGSLKNLKKMFADKKAEYDHYVVVAATTPTYCWVGLPGLIAAATVAGVFGDRAVKALKEVHRLEDDIAKQDLALNTALQTNKVQDAALASLKETQRYTDLAIAHTTTVQKSWQAISASLSYVADKVAKMTTQQDAQTVLASMALVKRYAKISGEKWDLLIPPLKALTRDPYIVVEKGEKSFGDLAKEVEKEIAKKAA